MIEKSLEPEFPGYSINEVGDIFSFKNGKKTKLKIGIRNGYKYVCLRTADGKNKKVDIHRMVLFSFFGPPEFKKSVCRHLDGNPLNNHFSNLKWGTYKENSQDRNRHNTMFRGEQVGISVLKKEDIPNIFNEFLSGLSTGQISKKYKVTPEAISNVLNSNTWTHVQIKQEDRDNARKILKEKRERITSSIISNEIARLICEFVIKENKINYEQIKQKFDLKSTSAIRPIFLSDSKKKIRDEFNFDFNSLPRGNESISDEMVREVFSMYCQFVSPRKIGEKLGICTTSVRKIITRKIKSSVFLEEEILKQAKEIFLSRKKKCQI